jgi:hypothetical protein
VGVRIVENASEADWPRGSVATLEIVQSDFYGTGHAGFPDKHFFYSTLAGH